MSIIPSSSLDPQVISLSLSSSSSPSQSSSSPSPPPSGPAAWTQPSVLPGQSSISPPSTSPQEFAPGHPLPSTIVPNSPTPSSSNPENPEQVPFSKRKRVNRSQSSNPSKSAKPNQQSSNSNHSNVDIQNLGFDPFHPHPGMTKDERKLARMIRNRTAAQASRDRKKEHVAELENRVKELESQLEAALSQHKCQRPCCRLAADPVILASSAVIDPAVVASAPSEKLLPLSERPQNSIDPTIMGLAQAPVTASSPVGEVDLQSAPTQPFLQIPLGAPIDQLPSQDSVTTLSPMQSEYLSKARIHILEEENAQLRARLDFELKKAHQLGLRLLNYSFHDTASQMRPEDFDLDNSLLRLILGDQKTENTLVPPLSIPRPSNVEPCGSSANGDSLDWSALLSESSGVASNPNPESAHFSLSTNSKITPLNLSEVVSMPNPSIQNCLNPIEIMKDPVTPSNQYKSQTPSLAGSFIDDSATVDSTIGPNESETQPDRRLVAREILKSQQRKDLVRVYPGNQSRTQELASKEVTRLCPLSSLTLTMMIFCSLTDPTRFGWETKKHQHHLEMRKVYCYFCWVALIVQIVRMVKTCLSHRAVRFTKLRRASVTTKSLRNLVSAQRTSILRGCSRADRQDFSYRPEKNLGVGSWTLLRMKLRWIGRRIRSMTSDGMKNEVRFGEHRSQKGSVDDFGKGCNLFGLKSIGYG